MIYSSSRPLLSNAGRSTGSSILSSSIAAQLRLLVVLALLLLYSPSSLAQCPVCQAVATTAQTAPAAKMCSGQAQGCLQLECSITAGAWYLSPTVSNITIGSSPIHEIIPDYKILYYQGAYRLNITTLKQQSHGVNRFLAIELGTENPMSCYFSVFVSDTVNTNGNFTLNNATKRVSIADPFVVSIDSFNSRYYYSYALEAQPLEFLVVNGSQVPSTPCLPQDQQQPWLGCLQTDEIEFHVDRCVSTYRVSLSYGFDNFLGDLTVAPRTFNQTITLQYPPKVRYNVMEVPFKSFNQRVDLKCEVECGNPSTNYRYTWRNADNTLLSESISSNTYSYEVNADSAEDTFEVICTVDNGILTNSVSESQTRFYIRYLNAPISGKGNTLPVWAIVLIAVGGFLLLVLLIAAVVLLVLRNNKKEKEPPIEPRGINPDLTSNPVYGNVKLANINRTGAQNDGFMSDRVYQIEKDFDTQNSRNSTNETSTKTKV